MLWIIYGTYYIIKDKYLQYRSGPLEGQIPIDFIHTVIRGKTLWVGYKPATATKGLIIKYNKYNEIYFSPSSNDLFLEELQKKNSAITITEA